VHVGGIFQYTVHIIIIFGGGFALVLAMGQLALRDRGLNNYLLAAAFVLLGTWQTLGGIMFIDAAGKLAFNVFVISVPVFYFSLPFLYFYFKSVLHHGFRLKAVHALHFLPPAASLVLLLPYSWKKFDLYKVMNLSGHGSWTVHEIVAAAVMYSSMVIFTAYLARIVADILDLLKDTRSDRVGHIRTALFGAMFLILVNVFWFVDRALSLGLSWVSYCCVTAVLIGIYVLSNRYPEYLLIIRLEAERVRYARSQIEKLDAGLVVKKLHEIMSVRKAYRDERISLKGLASELSVTAHQLSEIINTRLGTSFYAMVNEYRVREAKELLVRHPERTILAIAFDVGFNSASAFYNAFRRVAGVTPTRYREEGHAE
jgi:AraC-like DNA-binding protein